MNELEIFNLLESEIENFPQRTSSEELYRYFLLRTKPFVKSDRKLLVVALSKWIKLRTEPKTMLALEIATKNNLIELITDIKELLKDVQEGKAFLKYYEDSITDSLNTLIN